MIISLRKTHSNKKRHANALFKLRVTRIYSRLFHSKRTETAHLGPLCFLPRVTQQSVFFYDRVTKPTQEEAEHGRDKRMGKK